MPEQQREEKTSADVVIVGAGIAGLSAAYELSRAGRSVLVVEMNSVYGGHALISTGGLSIIDTALQRKRGIADSPDLAFADFMAWGEDNNEAWVRYYVEHSSEEIHDWLIDLGAKFTVAVAPSGNSVPRYHFVEGQGFGLMMPIYRSVYRETNLRIRFSMRAEEIIREKGRVVGLRATDLRTGQKLEIDAAAVLIATGGMQSDLNAVVANWREDLPEPFSLLAGSGRNSMGAGLHLAADVGARIERLDHQWNYVTGIPDPRYPFQSRGLSALQVPPGGEVWLNLDGERFVNECSSPRDNLAVVLEQPSQTHWVVFDSRGKRFFRVSGSGWTEERTRKWVFENPGLMKSAPTLQALADTIRVDVEQLSQSIAEYNALAERAEQGETAGIALCGNARTIDEPPYYAIKRFVLSRKTMGGIRIDTEARVLDTNGEVIPGLFAAGEATGFAGINGRAALEGTHLGPSIVTGRVAGRAMAAELAGQPVVDIKRALPPIPRPPGELGNTSNSVCTGCHDIRTLVLRNRSGYEHFRWSHEVVIDEKMRCMDCHEEFFPYEPEYHVWDLGRETEICAECHAG